MIDIIPESSDNKKISIDDSLSPVAPYRIVNIGNSNKVKLIDFIDTVEEILNKKAIRNYMPIQKGDMISTWADTTLLKNLADYNPSTNFKDGISEFITWYKNYYI